VSRATLDKAIERHQGPGREHEAQRARFAAAGATAGVVAKRQANEAQPIEMEAG
jgi:hypothetical protein